MKDKNVSAVKTPRMVKHRKGKRISAKCHRFLPKSKHLRSTEPGLCRPRNQS